MTQDPTPRLTTLPNGLSIVTRQMPGLHSAALGIWVSAGGRNERAEQNGIGGARHFERFGRKRMAVALIGDAAHIAFEQYQAGQRQRVEHAQRRCGHFGADPVAGQNCDLHAKILANRSRNCLRAAITSARMSAIR